MARRGISRDRILSTVRSLGAELPPATSQMLRWAYGRGIDVRVLSDCNSVFIGHVLQGGTLLLFTCLVHDCEECVSQKHHRPRPARWTMLLILHALPLIVFHPEVPSSLAILVVPCGSVVMP
jgi:hypothetical protein